MVTFPHPPSHTSPERHMPRIHDEEKLPNRKLAKRGETNMHALSQIPRDTSTSAWLKC